MEVGINLNGDLPLRGVMERAEIAEESGFASLWIGESPSFYHPFPLLAASSEATAHIPIGSGILSPLSNRCFHIRRAFETLKEVYGDRYLVALAPGDRYALASIGVEKRRIEAIVDCHHRLREWGVGKGRLFIGAAGPRMIQVASSLADGVLLNYVDPDFLRWALRRFEKATPAAAYGPALLLPDEENRGAIRTAAAIVAAGLPPPLQEEFDLTEVVREVRALLRKGRYRELKAHEPLLLERFTLTGTGEEMQDRIEEIRALGIHQTIFGSPASRNPASIRKLGALFRE
jgi:5,10-methylenetetrahydromethanopterin reductase